MSVITDFLNTLRFDDEIDMDTAVDLMSDAADVIEQQATEIEQLKRERDAAIADMRLIKQRDDSCLMCKYVDEEYPHCGEIGCWQWRGIKEDAEDG